MKKIFVTICAVVTIVILLGMNVQASTIRPLITNVVQEELRVNDSQDLVRLTISTNTVVDTVWVRHSTPERFPRAKLINTQGNSKTWEIEFIPLNPGSQYMSVEANRGFFTGGARQRIFVIHPDDIVEDEADANKIPDEIAEGFLTVINNVRAEHGLNPLYWNEYGAQIARRDIKVQSRPAETVYNEFALLLQGQQLTTRTDFYDDIFVHLNDSINNTIISRIQLFDGNILNPAVTSVGGYFHFGDPIFGAALLNPGAFTNPRFLMYFGAGDIVAYSIDPLNILNLWEKGYSRDEILDMFEKEVFRLTNIERVKQGVPALIWDGRLADAARAHSRDMSENRFVGHVGSDGSTIAQRIARTGLRVNNTGENTAGSGILSPQLLFEGWMNSPPHRRAILDRTYTHIGVGTYFYILDNGRISFEGHTQKFATIR
jgi:uncharacterized protein YkwD